MNESLMTEAPAATTTEGQPASQGADTQAAALEVQGEGEQSAQQQQATEGQNAEAQKVEGEQQQGEKAKPEGAPESYEFKAPEGSEFDPDVIGQFSEVAKELNLSQDAAQKIIDKIAPVLAEKQERVMQEARTEWAEASKSDKEFGGERLAENLSVAKKALDAFGSQELRSLLNESGLGNHPEVIRFMVRAGKAISEDGFVQGTRASTSEADPAKRLFPNQA